MKYICKILATLLIFLLAMACSENHELNSNNPTLNTEAGVFGDEMRLCLNVVAPDPIEVSSRAVDPDGKTLQTLHLFCFDANGLFLTTVAANIKGKDDSEDNLEGTFSATIPKTTRIIHLLANQNMSAFDKDKYVFRTEDDVLSALEGSAGMLIYWARIEAPVNVNEYYTEAQYEENHQRTDAEAFVDWITIETNPTSESHRGIGGKGKPIILLRNQAKFTIVSEGEGSDATDDWKGTYFEVTGFAICNTPAFGTVAPYHTEYGFPTYACTTFTPQFGVVDNQEISSPSEHYWLNDANVTFPARRDKVSDVADVTNQREIYIFETNNLGTDPVDLILRGYNIVNGVKQEEKYYYRVNLLDEEGEFVKILRNHHYTINISGNLTNGCISFGEAVVAPPTNNIWLSISDEVNTVRNNDYILSVDQTKVIVQTNSNGQPEISNLELKFNVDIVNHDKEFDESKLKIYWAEDNQKVSMTYNPSLVVGRNVTYDIATGQGTINLMMNRLGDGIEYERGSIVVKYGQLQRKIRVLLLRTKEFIPTWVSSEVYGVVTGDAQSRSNVTVVFTIPDSCPDELFPMDVLVTTNGLDGRASTGQVLPIVRAGEDGYGDTFTDTAPDGETVTDLGYKYKLTVTEPGQHSIFFQNILNMGNASKEYVTVEAAYFNRVTKMVTYVDHKNKIVLPFLASYSATGSDPVQYVLVAPKRYAPVTFDISLKTSDDTNWATLDKEEFLLYSTNLDHYPDDDTRIGNNEEDKTIYYPLIKSDFDCIFRPYGENVWSTGGRVFGFYPRSDKANGFWENKKDNANNSHQVFQIYMETNKPNSAEVVRIASNQKGSASVKDASQSYNSTTFRSVTFELANYRPFRFATQVKYQDNYRGGYKNNEVTDEPEEDENLEVTYEPNQEVAVAFDVTSYQGTDGTSVHPFGSDFEIFIDAPMLELDEEDPQNAKLLKANVTTFDKRADGTHFTEDKPKLQDLGNGRFVYRVDGNGAVERDHWDTTKDEYKAKIEDASIPAGQGITQDGERKVLKFRTKNIVSAGEITVSANPEHITYHSKTFNVSNTPIKGSIKYKTESNEEIQLPFGQFVSFTREYDGNRIGSLVVTSNNEDDPTEPTYYELRLRAEYAFEWTQDPIILVTQIDGKYYTKKIDDLKTLYEMAENEEPVILELAND